MTKELAAAVVLYNQRVGDSPTCRGLRPAEDVTVLVFDNSTKDLGNRAACEALGWTYLGGSGNLGLSKAYNACVDALAARGFKGLLCLFDDDTDLEPAYFAALREAAAEQPDASIFVPVIESAGKILSPCLVTPGQKVTQFADEAAVRAYRGPDFSAINSGMAVALSLFDGYRYDERIFLDGIDHHFVADMKARGAKFAILRYRCRHAFSGDSRPPQSAALTRFRIFSKDYAYLLQKQPGAYRKLVGKRALHLTLQYRTAVFLRACRQAWAERQKNCCE